MLLQDSGEGQSPNREGKPTAETKTAEYQVVIVHITCPHCGYNFVGLDGQPAITAKDRYKAGSLYPCSHCGLAFKMPAILGITLSSLPHPHE